MLRQRLKELMRELDCIQHGRFELASGGVSNYKIFCDPLFENCEAKEILGALGSQMLQSIDNNESYDIVGVIRGGYEFAKLIGEKAGIEIVGVNPHDNTVIGSLEHENRLYAEDVTTKGGSIIKCHKVLGDAQGDAYALAMVDRQEGAEQNLANNGIKLKLILTKDDLGI